MRKIAGNYEKLHVTPWNERFARFRLTETVGPSFYHWREGSHASTNRLVKSDKRIDDNGTNRNSLPRIKHATRFVRAFHVKSRCVICMYGGINDSNIIWRDRKCTTTPRPRRRLASRRGV